MSTPSAVHQEPARRPAPPLKSGGTDCGRWDNGRLGQSCSLAGSEYCDFECPFHNDLHRKEAA